MFFALALIVLALPSIASGQATRTWVSGVGDDANPCSRTAPCKTFAGAISKTATKGEINCLDPGGFGGVTIGKALTIKCHYTEGGVLVSGTNAIVVNAPSTDAVTLRGLDINGLGTGLNGIRIISARSVKVLDSEIYGFTRDGIDEEPSNNPSKLGVYNTHIHDNTGVGVMAAPPTTGNAKVTIQNSIIEDDTCAIVAATFGPDPAFGFGTNCGTATSASGITGRATINAIHNLLIDASLNGAFSRGSNATVRVGDNGIFNNGTGLAALDGAATMFSYGDNFFGGNGNNGGGFPAGNAKG
jgi:Right handed beta helix region